jgi:hypothetical protein
MYLLFFSFAHDLVNSLLSLVSFVLQKDKENVLNHRILRIRYPVSIMLQMYYHSKIFGSHLSQNEKKATTGIKRIFF